MHRSTSWSAALLMSVAGSTSANILVNGSFESGVVLSGDGAYAPAPGAAALLGVACLAAARRRHT